MGAWPSFGKTLDDWRDAMRRAGLDGRAQDTYGVLLASANLMLGDEAMESAGLPITEPGELGRMIALATASERTEQTDNWRACLERLLQSTIDAWKSGEKPTVGHVLQDLESGQHGAHSAEEMDETLDGLARRKLSFAGLGLKAADRITPGARGWLLAIPTTSPALERIFAGTIWGAGVWTHALKQAPADVVIRDRGNGQVVKINRVSQRCVLVNLEAYDLLTRAEYEYG